LTWPGTGIPETSGEREGERASPSAFVTGRRQRAADGIRAETRHVAAHKEDAPIQLGRPAPAEHATPNAVTAVDDMSEWQAIAMRL